MRKIQTSIAAPLGLAVAAHLLPALSGVSSAVAGALGIATRIDHARGVALTFDDGPHRFGTPAVLDALDAGAVKATFFLVGEQVVRDPAIAREIADRGHTIGLHCERHRNALRLTQRQVRDDLERSLDQIASATGAVPSLYRPPYGVFSGALVHSVRRLRLTPLLWSKAGNDWKASATGESIAERVTDGLSAGDVLLLHDADDYSAPGSWRNTADALPAVIDSIQRAGLLAVVPKPEPARHSPSGALALSTERCRDST